MKRKERYDIALQYLEKQYPNPETELNFSSPFELLVSVVLSAQCTDIRVNLVTPNLFKNFPTSEEMSNSTQEEIFELIKSISYPNSKAKYLLQLSKLLQVNFGGQVPLTVEELMTLPGVGRKTANVVTSVLDQQPNMAVDTHVLRLSHRLGLVPSTANTPEKVERILTQNIPTHIIHKAHHWLILYGRYICKAKKPFCSECKLYDICVYKHKS